MPKRDSFCSVWTIGGPWQTMNGITGLKGVHGWHIQHNVFSNLRRNLFIDGWKMVDVTQTAQIKRIID
jgi:hypothetical protein